MTVRHDTLPSGRTSDLLAQAAFVALVGGMGLVTVVATLTGNVFVTVLPILLFSVAFLVTRIPLRWSVIAVLYLAIGNDSHLDMQQQWRTPLSVLGDLLHGSLPGLAVTGLELLTMSLLALAAYRRATGATVDGTRPVLPMRAIRDVLTLFFVGVGYAWMLGVAQGQGVVLWKLRNLLQPILLFFLFLAAFRPQDRLAIGRLVVVSACARAILAVIVQRMAIADTGGRWETATDHGDSVLFAVAIFMLVASFLEKVDRRRLPLRALLLVVIMVGALENERRIVWVMILMALTFMYLVTPMRGWKLHVTRVIVVGAPVIALYVGIGWNSTSKIFGPVETIRSVADTSKDHSSYWREVENWNIAMSLRQKPIMGLGLGGQYTEYMANDDVSGGFKEYREWPHNSVLGLLLLMGLFGFTASWMLLPFVVFLSIRSYRLAAAPEQRVAALTCVSAAIACFVMAYGDTGAHFPQSKIFQSLAMAVSAVLAGETGAMRPRQRVAA